MIVAGVMGDGHPVLKLVDLTRPFGFAKLGLSVFEFLLSGWSLCKTVQMLPASHFHKVFLTNESASAASLNFKLNIKNKFNTHLLFSNPGNIDTNSNGTSFFS